jgi:hypothetical protein
MRIVTAVGAMLIVLVGAEFADAQTSQQRIDTALMRAGEAGIPVSLLESKIAEGRAKGVSMDRIAAAVERREVALERASQALKGRPEIEAADLSIGADAVESGVSEAVLRTLAETAPRDRRVVAIAALTELVRQGQVPQAALDRVREALKRGPDALANLPAQAAAGKGRGTGSSDVQQPETDGGRGRGQSGPPASVPSPGGASAPTKPGGKPDDKGKPEDKGKPTTTPSPGAGRGRSDQT